MTALETFWEQIAEILPFSLDSETAIKLYEKYQECKQIEKQQKEECWNVAHQAGRFVGKGIAERNWHTFHQYYNETYGNKQTEDLTFKKKSQWTKIDNRPQ